MDQNGYLCVHAPNMNALTILLLFLFDPFEKCESIVSLFVFMKEQVRQQGEYESLHHDLNIGFGAW
ncbi:hypothetical protein HanRHA438_Chr01g0043191 [Helianthus annuus]|nr:hypothetical protein HanIR_Chr01g0046921 [Helianthus annuus]KAJ0949862.1 hypothetical protein HanRHA438_Chr01g0043191 [Helianthus annuus]